MRNYLSMNTLKNHYTPTDAGLESVAMTALEEMTEIRSNDILENERSLHSPIPYALIPTTDPDSYKEMSSGSTGPPLSSHPWSYGAVRKYDIHTGVDLYCDEWTPVYSIEPGTVVKVMPFTWEKIDMPWWLDTDCVMVEWKSGVWLYGEISTHLQEWDQLNAWDLIGKVKRVLRNDKWRPTSMLHVELMKHWSRRWYSSHDEWAWDVLEDPTPYLMKIAKKGVVYNAQFL